MNLNAGLIYLKKIPKLILYPFPAVRILKIILWICTFPISLLFWPLSIFARKKEPLFVTRVGSNIRGYALPGELVHYTAEGPLIDKHFKLSESVETAWKSGDRKKILKAINAHIAIAPKIVELMQTESQLNGEDYIPEHTGYTRLAMLLEREKNYAAAISACEAAISLGFFVNSYEHRMARCRKKLEAKALEGF